MSRMTSLKDPVKTSILMRCYQASKHESVTQLEQTH